MFVLVHADQSVTPQRGMTCFVCEKEPGAASSPGLTVPPQIKKLGYKGIVATELVLRGSSAPPR